jgi:hypothetical protein
MLFIPSDRLVKQKATIYVFPDILKPLTLGIP